MPLRETIAPHVSRSVIVHLLALLGFVLVAVFLRGLTISVWTPLNPDEAELMAQARAAMKSPVPFSTWTSGTTGPFWVLFLALLGWMGAPLTLAFAHLLAAVLVGLLGYVAWVLLRRSFGTVPAVVIGLLWWLPLVVVFPLGGLTDFGALATELLPGLLVLVAALTPVKALAARPWLFLFVGLLCGLAVGSKYQVLPLAVGLVVVQLVATGFTVRRSIAPLLFWAMGAVIPFALVALAMLLSPTTSLDLLLQNFSFLGSYATGVDLWSRIRTSTRLLLGQPYLAAALLGITWLALLSAKRVALSRVLMVLVGLAAVYGGGKGFGHYLILLYIALALATVLPIRSSARLLPSKPLRVTAVAVSALLVASLLVVGGVTGRVAVTAPVEVGAALSPDSVVREERLATACPSESKVLVWGWAAELYVDYSWTNTVPFMNTLGISSDAASRDAGAGLVERAIDESDCVVDAVGAPFFGVGPESSITLVFPQFTSRLNSEFTVVQGALDCDACTVYLRK